MSLAEIRHAISGCFSFLDGHQHQYHARTMKSREHEQIWKKAQLLWGPPRLTGMMRLGRCLLSIAAQNLIAEKSMLAR